MNFLAHLYLSGESEEVILGNFAGDAVKGRDLTNYSTGMATGIKLHRFIDDFTDNHPIVEESKVRLRPKYRKYAGVVVDMFYDHFLATHWDNYHHHDLPTYVKDMYSLLERNNYKLPERTQYMLKYMIAHDWLGSYVEISGIIGALSGLSRRTSFVSRLDETEEDLVKHYDEFKDEFIRFFPILREQTSQELIKLMKA